MATTGFAITLHHNNPVIFVSPRTPKDNKMAKLSSLLLDTDSIENGRWVMVNPVLFDDLEIHTRGFTDKFVDVQAGMQARIRRDLNLRDTDPLPNDKLHQINAKLAADYLILNVRGLEADDGQPVSVDDFKRMLSHPDAKLLTRAVFDAAAQVSNTKRTKVEQAVGNLPLPSASTSSSGTTESAP